MQKFDDEVAFWWGIELFRCPAIFLVMSCLTSLIYLNSCAVSRMSYRVFGTMLYTVRSTFMNLIQEVKVLLQLTDDSLINRSLKG